STWGQEASVDSQFESMKTKFIDKGIPVILGEYAATLRLSLPPAALEKHKKSRINYLSYVNTSAKRYGLIPFYWDSGHTGDNGSGLFDRNKALPFYQDAIDAIVTPFK
ncbi:DNA mismatch repair protein, partial [Pseudoxanthomonas sp. SGD-10]